MRLCSARSLLGYLLLAFAFPSPAAPGGPGSTPAQTGTGAAAARLTDGRRDEAASAKAERPAGEVPFDLQISEQTIPGAGPVFRCYLTAERSRFSFVLPSGLRAAADPAGKTVMLTSSDYTCAIDLQVIESQSVAAPQADALRPIVLRRFPGAQLLGEFVATAAGRSGPGFDLERLAEQDRKLCTRLVFVPFQGGMLEFKLTTPPEKFSSLQHRLNQLLLSFRAGTHQQPPEVQTVIPD